MGQTVPEGLASTVLGEQKSEAAAFNSFRSLLLRFAERHRFRHRPPCISKVTQRVLDEVWLGYAASFWSKYAQYDRSQLLSIKPPCVKLPLLFILKGQPGGVIDKKELSTYPAGHFYAVQKNAWMDERVWSMYLDEVLAPCLDLPPNSTSRCQPLDVGVMGPLKAMLKTAWLLEEDSRSSVDDVFTAQEKRLAMVKRTILVPKKSDLQW
ncbi:hypothetical protein H257_18068 [Aphanomyces astaci]|uniref:DDE-1 domain-containing protein n=1 Tax=Aphanomyces astaci TaxID=112090 RepID=W4FCC9_APHAT|nr:hypothetical protein H257_18068 [Aphanomyces astaci]ETV65142.1 hypothetical protein H257_18068 [Aphanomyces astaci]|eukprot:XP_009845380.1 hypothetical protein H257_18068 [Aphanomyces astaci]